VFKLTKEQEKILEKAKNMQVGEVLLINALAGCAKTSTLKMVAEQNRKSRFLYLAFNRNIVDEATKTFPSNTKATTLHSLARSYSGGRKELKYLNMDTMREVLNYEIKSKNQYFEIFNALKAYENFCKSAFSIYELDELKNDIRVRLKEDFLKRNSNKNMDYIIEQRVNAVDLVENIHNSILNSNFTTFDTFLKEFVESAEFRTFNYDYIVLDESQDVSKLLAKFIISLIKSKRYKIVVVGDNNQKIYGFLGNTNLSLVIQKLYGDRVTTMNLTRSFRFKKNSKMEVLSNKILRLRGENIVGARASVPPVSKNDKIAFLSRGTFPILAMCIHQIANGKDFYLYGGVKNFNIQEIEDIYNLFTYTKKLKNKLGFDIYIGSDIEKSIKLLADNKDEKLFPDIKSNTLKAFSSFVELEHFASTRAIFDLLDNISIVYFIYSKRKILKEIDENSTNHIVEQFFSLIETHSNKDSHNIISTIHKSKGLEFESVVILKSLVVSMVDGRISSVSSEIGNILGLSSVDIDLDGMRYSSNKEFVNILNRAEKDDSNIFYKKSNDLIEDILGDSSTDNEFIENKKILNELIINNKMNNIREEYNILYVAITRAIRDIKISNSNYIETLMFLDFINENLDEFIKIVNGDKSSLLVEIERRVEKDRVKKEKGIIYKRNFISVNTLIKFLKEL